MFHRHSFEELNRTRFIYINIQGIKQTLLSIVIYNKYICPKKEKQQYIFVGTARMFIEPSAKH